MKPRLTLLLLVAAGAALMLSLWHTTEINTECQDKGGLLLRDMTGFVCVAGLQRVAP